MEGIIDIFKKVLIQCVKINASDLHLCAGTLWKYRLNGHITAINLKPLDVAECAAIVKHIIANSHLIGAEEIDKTLSSLRDMDCTYAIPDIFSEICIAL